MLEKRIFNNGMNGDMEDRLIQPGEFRYGLNIRAGVSDNENMGVIENTKGNELVDYPLIEGKHTCIGSIEDKKFKVVYYFLHNSLGNHSIYEFNIATRGLQPILVSSGLNFDKDHLITGVNLIEGELLKWTDDYNEPRAFNVKRSYPSGALSDVNIEQTISNIKYTPLEPPTVSYNVDSTKKINNLYGNLWQFRYRYVYLDNEKSAFSPISKIDLPHGEDAIHTGESYSSALNNVIDVSYKTGLNIVKRVEIAARQGNLGNWLLIEQDEQNAGSNANSTFKFYNDEVYSAIDVNEANKLYDAVPKKAKAQDIIDGNRLAYGNIVDGFDQVETSIGINYEELGSPEVQNMYSAVILSVFDETYTFLSGAGNKIEKTAKYGKQEVNYKYWGDGANAYNPTEGDVVTVKIGIIRQDGTDNIKETYEYSVLAGDTKTDIINHFVDEIYNDQQWYIDPDDSSLNGVYRVLDANLENSATGPYLRVRVNPDPSVPGDVPFGLKINITQPNITSFVSGLGYVYELDGTQSTSYVRGEGQADEIMTPKLGAKHKYGVVYSDQAGRLSTTMGSIDLDVPWVSDLQNPGPVNVLMALGHQPPEWAHHYHIVYSPTTDVGNFIQVVIGGQSQGGANTLISVQPTLTDYRNNYPGNILSYSLTKGDRCRFIRHEDGTFFSEYIDVEIIGFTSLNQMVLSTLPDGFTLADIKVGMLAEIYSPRKDAELQLYHEIGESFPILNPGTSDRVHSGNVQNQTTAGADAIIRLENTGDSYWRRRNIGLVPNKAVSSNLTNYNTFLEDPNFSDFYESEIYNTGRPNVVDLGAEETRRPATIFYSEPFIPNTNINGLSSFFLLNFEEYDRNYGSIQRLYAENKRLICFQELKVGSILVNEIIYRDLAGGSSVGASESILSTMVYYSGEFGIGLNPESFAVYGNRKYFVDANRGAVLRLSTDGITPISDAMMRNYFNDTLNEYVKNSVNPILGVYDKRFDEYIISIVKTITNEFFIDYSEVSTGLNDIIDVDGDSGVRITDYDGNLQVGSVTTVTYIRYTAFDPKKDKLVNPIKADIDLTIKDIVEVDGLTYLIFDSTELEGVFGFGNSDVVFNTSNTPSSDTLAFCEPLKKWTTFYSYSPDYMSESIIDIITWRKGKLYIHNSDNVPYNNFYGVQYDSRVHVVSNENNSNIKFYKSLQEESTSVWEMSEGTNQFGKKTNLIEDDFETIEGHHYAPFWKDENTVNVDNPLIEGDFMRSYTMGILLVNNSTELEKLFSVGIRYEASELSNR